MKPKQGKPRQDAARAAATARRRTARIRNLAVAGMGLAVVAGFVYLSGRRDAALPGDSVAQMPSPHIVETDPTPVYNADPPTSGPHLAAPAAPGVYPDPVPKAAMVHSLEDGEVVISYRPDLDTPTLDKLTTLANEYPDDVLLAPYPGLTSPIVLTAWNRVDRLEALDEARVRAFVDAWGGKDHHPASGS